ncbi:hypothetical protein GB928_004110 [Shinella curvata]|uniref:Uncharacterized protein n=1 Tax=Shinella curvata TaxID=1817964 RepID=A0ABT8X9E5_9HYPH|nr:hypothetical protein [Shinella curvata]MCJ8051694.1 hypothetical protein [Shinella curvata]MDO6120359.1 hypothetical protein [Shinella curvata]
MHTALQTTDRRLTPRRLVPRRPSANPYANNPGTIAKWLDAFHAERPHRFQAGDEVTFETADGCRRNFYILELMDGEVAAFFYDGNPHLVQVSMADVDDLRIVSTRQYLDAEALDMYRALVGLDIEAEVAA